MAVRTALVALAAAAALAAAPAAASPLHVDGQRLADPAGGTVLLRGTALIDKFRDGIPDAGLADWQRMRSLGFNSVRLGTAWEYIEPHRGEYDHAYLDALAGVAREAMDHGLYVVVDMHQDVWGPPLGNGAPEWTVYPECEPLAAVDFASLTGVWAMNYLAPWTFCQFTRFWSDPDLQERFSGAWREVARRLGGEARLAGYDLLNEPFEGFHPPAEFETTVLYPFYERLAGAIRDVDPDAVVFEEPANYKNVHLPTTPAVAARSGAVYSPHVYGVWDASDAFSRREGLIAANMRWSQLEARVMDVPLWYGEFGMRRGAPGAEASLAQIYDTADAQLAGASYWEWSRDAYGPMQPDGSLDPVRARTLARAYPMRTAGDLLGFSFDSASGAFEMRWEQAEGAGVTQVALPTYRYGDAGLDVGAGPGVSWTFDAVRGVLEVSAPPGERMLRVTARG